MLKDFTEKGTLVSCMAGKLTLDWIGTSFGEKMINFASIHF